MVNISGGFGLHSVEHVEIWLCWGQQWNSADEVLALLMRSSGIVFQNICAWPVSKRQFRCGLKTHLFQQTCNLWEPVFKSILTVLNFWGNWRWFLGRLFDKVILIKSVLNSRLSMHAYVRAYVRPSTENFFNFSDIWHVGRGRWVMHSSMQYDPIQNQDHVLFKVGNPAVFKSCLLRHSQWELATDNRFLNQGTISKFDRAGFLIFGRVFVSHDFEVGRIVSCGDSIVGSVRRTNNWTNAFRVTRLCQSTEGYSVRTVCQYALTPQRVSWWITLNSFSYEVTVKWRHGLMYCCHSVCSVSEYLCLQATAGTSSVGFVAAGVSSERLARHLGIVLSKIITSVISTGELCPRLSELGFKIDKVAMSPVGMSIRCSVHTAYRFRLCELRVTIRYSIFTCAQNMTRWPA